MVRYFEVVLTLAAETANLSQVAEAQEAVRSRQRSWLKRFRERTSGWRTKKRQRVSSFRVLQHLDNQLAGALGVGLRHFRQPDQISERGHYPGFGELAPEIGTFECR